MGIVAVRAGPRGDETANTGIVRQQVIKNGQDAIADEAILSQRKRQ